MVGVYTYPAFSVPVVVPLVDQVGASLASVTVIAVVCAARVLVPSVKLTVMSWTLLPPESPALS